MNQLFDVDLRTDTDDGHACVPKRFDVPGISSEAGTSACRHGHGV